MTHKLKGALNIATDLEMTPQASAPTPSQGLVYFDLAEQRLKVCNNGTTYEAIGFADTPMAHNGLTVIRQLQDRAIIFSKNFNDGFADAYIDADGRMNSVTTANTTAIFSGGNLEYGTTYTNRAGSDTVTSSASRGSWSSTNLSFDSNNSTSATMAASWTSISGSESWTLGTTWVGGISLTSIYVNTGFSGTTSSTDNRATSITLEWFNGSVWATVQVLVTQTVDDWSQSFNSNVSTSLTGVQGLRLSYSRGTASSTGYTAAITQTEIQYGNVAAAAVIEHAIPSGTFPATVSKAIGIGMLSQIEAGASMRFKLQNATEDSGWILCYSYPKLTKFTAFTSEPTKCIVQLIPKSPSGTVGIPAIKGFWVYAE